MSTDPAADAPFVREEIAPPAGGLDPGSRAGTDA